MRSGLAPANFLRLRARRHAHGLRSPSAALKAAVREQKREAEARGARQDRRARVGSKQPAPALRLPASRGYSPADMRTVCAPQARRSRLRRMSRRRKRRHEARGRTAEPGSAPSSPLRPCACQLPAVMRPQTCARPALPKRGTQGCRA